MINDFLKLLRRCPGCGTSFGSFDWLCLQCLAKVSLAMAVKKRSITRNIDHIYLIDWEPGDLFMSRVVRSIKTRAPQFAYRFLTRDLTINSDSKRLICYPSKGLPDHAHYLAIEMGLRTKRDIRPLMREGGRKQAFRSRLERGQLRFKSVTQIGGAIDFVDDIVTTGSTAKAAFRASIGVKKMTVWSIFYRKNLRN